MKKPPLALKVAVVVCSVSLVAWFVAYRAGAFNSAPSSTSSTASDSAIDDPALIQSTKSGKILPNGDPEQSEANAESAQQVEDDSAGAVTRAARPRRVSIESFYIDEAMTSSKSGAIFTPPANQAATDSPDQKKRPMHIMGSSKNDDIFTPPLSDDSAPNSPNERSTFMGGSKKGEIFTPPPSDDSAPNKPAEPRRVTFMGSSKSAPVIIQRSADTIRIPKTPGPYHNPRQK